MNASQRRSQVLARPEEVAERLGQPGMVLIEVDDRPELYALGHPPGARLMNWREDLQDPVRRDLPSAGAIKKLWARLGVRSGSDVVLYGDLNNWLAAYAYWVFRSYGLTGVRLLDGGRQAWVAEGRPLTTDTPPAPGGGDVPDPVFTADWRADRTDVIRAAHAGALLDARTPQEYTGEWLTEPQFPGEAAHRAGHIPGATSLPWEDAVGLDGYLKPLEVLQQQYATAGLHHDLPIVTYCRIGERSAHTWIVLHELLDYPRVRNYDGSWTEWGSMTRMPIQLGHDRGLMSAEFTA